MYNTGARVQEVVDVQLEDLRLDSASQVKITGKGNKQRVCPLWEETITAINDYLLERNASAEDETHLFLNARGRKYYSFWHQAYHQEVYERGDTSSTVVKREKSWSTYHQAHYRRGSFYSRAMI